MSQIYKLHLFPVIALVFLTFGIMVLMGRRRFAAIRSGLIPVGYFKDYQQREPFLIPEKVQIALRNYINLFEIPILFYALIPLLIVTDRADNVTLLFSWIFVLSRYGHSIVHVTSNKIMLRFRLFGIGCFVLVLLWGRFLIQLLQS